MSSHRFFNFKMRLSTGDWEMLSDVMVKENPFYTRKAQRDWFFNQVNRFCREVALPLLDSRSLLIDEGENRLEKSILIQEIPFDNSTNLNILRDFAECKQKTITQVIQKYIVDNRLLKEEKGRLIS